LEQTLIIILRGVTELHSSAGISKWLLVLE